MKSKQSAASRNRGRCTVCVIYKGLTESGDIKAHKRHDAPCPGSLRPPWAPPVTAKSTWSSSRRATFERDDHRCRKCLAGDDLEAHHVQERAQGGLDHADNLITLCGLCHGEWTFCEPALMTFETWLTLPPARYVLHALTMDWPTDKSAAAFKEQLLTTIALAMRDRRRPSG